MKIKKMPADYGSIEDRRREQKVTRGLKTSKLRVGGYKEDPEMVRARLDISRHMESMMRGKSDRELPDGLMEEMVKEGERMQKRRKK